MKDSATPAAGRRWRVHLVRVLLALSLGLVVLAAPTVVYHALWSWPRHVLPADTGVQEQQHASADMDAVQAGRLMAIVREARADAGLPSLSAAVMRTDGLAWAGAVGWADVEGRQPATVESRYRTGSIAKPITAVAMMRLVESGAMDLDAPGSAVVDKLPPALAPLTARQLASHTSGVRHYSPWPRWWPGWHEANSQQAFPGVEAGLVMFADDPLVHAPGNGFHYSTFGYSLLSRLLEGASARAFPQLLQEQVFAPVDMRGSAVDTPGAMPERVAFYEGSEGRYVRARAIDSSFRIAGGGLVSTPSDLARLGIALQGDGLLSATARKAMWTPQPLADGSANPQAYALGWRVNESTRLQVQGHPVAIVHHGGSQTGASAFLMLLPDQGLAVAVMSNSSEGRAQVQETASALAEVLLKSSASITGNAAVQ